jgi:predicted HTH domain antitoxin
MAKTATIMYPEELAESLELSDEQVQRELGFMAAAKLYELCRVSAGQAAEIAGLSRLAFLRRLAVTGVPAINLDGSEAEAEVEAARDLAG